MPQPEYKRRIFNYACWLLARRRYSETELRRKLQKKFPDDSQDNETIIKLFLERKYLDDTLYVTLFIREQMTRKPQGLRAIKEKLYQKGIPEAIINKVFTEATANQYSEDQLIKKAIEKKSAALRELPNRKRKEKLFRFLVSRGFAPGAIMKVLSSTAEI